MSFDLEQKYSKVVQNLKLSHSQRLKLQDAILFYLLSKNKEPILDVDTVAKSKTERNSYFEKLIASFK